MEVAWSAASYLLAVILIFLRTAGNLTQGSLNSPQLIVLFMKKLEKTNSLPKK